MFWSLKMLAILFTIVAVAEMLVGVEGGIAGLPRHKRQHNGHDSSSSSRENDGRGNYAYFCPPQSGHHADMPGEACMSNADCPPGKLCRPMRCAAYNSPKYCN